MSDTDLCQCGHVKRADRDGMRGQGHYEGRGRCLACLLCEQGAESHVPQRCGCRVFEPAERVTVEQAMTEGGVPCICGDHYLSGHDRLEDGGRCRVRHHDGSRCDCPGYEPDPRYIKEDNE
ncbi:hypothetical protein SEA_TYPHA_78 [Mycobacterium phage Typha]|uniref:Uncharacterized protein n=1 Tax=Mycobacterium phage Typha TaxID=2517971 RepID=A0A482J842_9CAUD|nr:hypothetical protein KCH40_gp091 [Mycobacterium phage Typha]QBP29733.1 hypothetical protein SEA_TYPHA_78 [Mycobacterium phage Typha]